MSVIIRELHLMILTFIIHRIIYMVLKLLLMAQIMVQL
nr:MAG TPA: hypothetical protein [Caudoviricetes sp.]DAQ36027.1 MAG TPA: hypothetical protein [Caudoviricetes sp.]DAS44947.1 MAG TPA: hypothetical protein [Caudoviricetes sp.]